MREPGAGVRHLGWIDAGEAAYRTALPGAADAKRVQAYRDLSFLSAPRTSGGGRRDLGGKWIGAVPGDAVTPYVELAKHHEWHTLDLAAARGWTAWALRIAEGWPPGYERGDPGSTSDIARNASRERWRGKTGMPPNAPG